MPRIATLIKNSKKTNIKKSKLERNVEKVFDIPFHTFIDNNFKIGDSRYHLRDTIRRMATEKGKPFKVSSSSIYYRVIYWIEKGYIEKFRFDLKYKGRKGGKTPQEEKRISIKVHCLGCGKKHKNKSIIDINFNLRSYQCPHCKTFGNSKAFIEQKGIKGIKMVKDVNITNTNKTIKRTVWVDEKENIIDSPFKQFEKE
jgi:hypothetical protein